MKVICETWNSVDFDYLLKVEYKTTKRKLKTPDSLFSLFKEYKLSGLHRGVDQNGAYFGWPGTGYDRPAYRVREIV